MTMPSGNQSFTQSSQALGQIVERFRTDTLPLEEALALFEIGVGHVRHCQTVLATCRGKVTELSEALATVALSQGEMVEDDDLGA
jgi:exodeoxyribonuclease VII small subunit